MYDGLPETRSDTTPPAINIALYSDESEKLLFYFFLLMF